MEELGTIKYGELRFHFNLTNEVFQFIQEKGMSRDFFIMSSQSFYQAVLFKLGIGHKSKKEIEVVFYSIKLKNENVFSEVDKSYMKFVDFPLQELRVGFGVKIK